MMVARAARGQQEVDLDGLLVDLVAIGAYLTAAAWSQPFEIAAKPEWEAAGLYEYVCEENNRCPGGKCQGK